MKRRLISRLLRSKSFLLGAFLLGAVILAALLAPALAPRDPLAQDLTKRLLGPAWAEKGVAQFLLGTDPLGRDLLSRLLYGARYSLAISGAAVGVSGILGCLLGVLAGYFGGTADGVIMRLADIQLAIPTILLATAVIAVLGTNLLNLVLVLALTGWVLYGRTVRGVVLSLKHREFIQAAVSLGAGDFWIMVRHVLPNVLTPAIVIGTQQLGFMILLEAALSFLGLGVQPPQPSWGGMIGEGRTYLNIAPWVVMVPGLALMITVLAVNFLGDGLRDALDPKTRM